MGALDKWMIIGALLACASCESRAEPAPDQPPAPTTAVPTPSTSASIAAPPEPPPEPWLTKTLRESSPEWKDWLERAEELRLQILVTVLEPSGDLDTHSFRADDEYFYPASAIKLPLAVVALSAMNERLGYPVPPMTRLMRCRYDRSGCEPPREDEDHERDKDEDGVYKHKKLRVGTELRKMLSYSDNDSYNRLWDIVGHREANEVARKLGLSSVRFDHRMNAPADKSISTQRVTLLPPGKKAVVIGKRKSDYALEPTSAGGLQIGKGYNAGGKVVEEPLDFASKNYVSLQELQRILLSLVRPEHPGALKLGLDDEQRQLLLKAMTARLASKKHAAEHNPFSPGVLEVVDHDAVRYVGKSGRAYGFHLDNAYIEDPKTKRALLATAVVYVNPNQILNDDDYEYDETSKPLLASLGRLLTEKLLFAKVPPREE